MDKIKYVLYARKSTEDKKKQIASIPSQISEMKKIAANEGLAIADILEEEKSAKQPGRPVFNKMVEMLNKGEVQGILCWKLDRLSRNPIDSGNISWMLQKNTIKHIRCFDRSYYPSDNVLVMSVEQGMANQFIRDLSTGVKRGLRRKASEGWFPHQPPIGYISDSVHKKGAKIVFTDPDRFILVRKIFDLMLTGIYTPPQIWKMTKKWGLKTTSGYFLSRSNVYHLLSDSFYYGEFEFPKGSGEWIKGKHKPMITREEFDRIQVLLGRKGNPRLKTYDFPYSGLLRCGRCGASITAEIKEQIICSECKCKFSYKTRKTCPKCNTAIENMKSPTILNYIYYHCTRRKDPNCTEGSIEAKLLEQQITDILDRIEIPAEFHSWAMDRLRMVNAKAIESRNKALEVQRKQYTECVKKLDALIDMRAKEELTDEEFTEKKASYLQEKHKLSELLNGNEDRNSWLESANHAFIFARDALRKFQTGSTKDKKQILRALGQNLTVKDRLLTVEIQEPLILIEKIAQEVRPIVQKLEPEKLADNSAYTEQHFAGNPMILRR